MISNSDKYINNNNNKFEQDKNKDINNLFFNEIDNINSIKQYNIIKFESSNPLQLINKYIDNSLKNIYCQIKKIKEYNEVQNTYVEILNINCNFLKSQINKIKLLNKTKKIIFKKK